MNVGGRKLFLIGFVVVLLVGIPLTVYLLQQQQDVRSRAEASTTLSFNPSSTATAPIQKNVGDSIPLTINIDPGKNVVDYVKVEIQYDPSVLATASANAFQVNTNALPTVLEGPIYAPGKIDVSLSSGADPTKVIQAATTLATINFTAIKNTPPGTPTLVQYTVNTQVLSTGSNDQASENVLSTSIPATIAIGGASVSPTESIPQGTPTPTIAVSETPTPEPTSAPSEAPTAVPTNMPTPTLAPSGAVTVNGTPPVCSSLTTDRATTGTAPFSLTFTANGSASAGMTISKVSFTFGDGQVSDVTQAGGIGTASVNVQDSHTYNDPGTFTATSTLTDNNNNVSAVGPCTQTITVNAASGSAGTSTSTTNPTPTMPPTGSNGLAVGLGIGTLLLIFGGGLIFFIL